MFRRPPNRAAARFVGISTFIEGFARGGRLETSAGSFAMGGLAGGGGRRIVVAIRPEHLWLVEQYEPNAVPGVVEDRTFQGEYWDTCARSARGSLRARSAAAPAIGAACTVALPARHLFVVEAPAATANGIGPSV